MAGLVLDDAGYYMAIARNYSMGLGWTYDRVSETNGYNPLFIYLLIGLNRVFARDLDLVACFRIATLATWVFLLAGLIPFRRFTRRVLTSFAFPFNWTDLAVATASLFYAGAIASKGLYGSDAFIALAIGLLCLDRISRVGLLSPRLIDGLIDGVLLGLIVLARLDSLALAFSAFGLMLFRVTRKNAQLGALVVRIFAFSIVVLPYFLFNKSHFGDYLPVSARLKSAFPHLDLVKSINVFFNELNNHDAALLLLVWIMALGWWIGALLAGAKSSVLGVSTGSRDAMFILAFYLSVRVSFLLFFSRLDVQSVYAILAWPFFAIVTLVWIGCWRPPRGAAAACGALCLLSMGLLGGKIVKVVPGVEAVATGRGDAGWELGRRIHDAVGDNGVIYGSAMGLPGYVSDRPWINGDGVANNFDYQEAIAKGELANYLACKGVTHVVVALSPARDLPPGQTVFKIPSYLYGITDDIVTSSSNAVLSGDLAAAGRPLRVWLLRWSAPEMTEIDETSCAKHDIDSHR